MNTKLFHIPTRILFRLSLIFILALCSVPLALCQVPEGFNYQAIVRNTSGLVIQNQPVKILVSIQNLGGTVFWNEEHSLTTTQFGLATFIIGDGPNISGIITNFSKIEWKAQALYLRTQVQYPVGSPYTDMGTTQIWSVPYSLVAKDVEGPVSKFGIKSTVTYNNDSALFKVINKDGNIVFAVYNEGVRVHVSDDTKGKKGGFAVGGFGSDKAESQPYMIVTADSIRMYLDSDTDTKGKKGGFAVGGFDMAKGTSEAQSYLDVSKDSVRIYIDTNPLTKKPKGGFAVGGYDLSKGGIIAQSYLDINADSIRMYIDDPSKGKKGGFAVGSFDMAKGGKSFLKVTTDSTRVYVSDASKPGSLGGFAVKPQVAPSAKTDFFNISSVPAAGIIKDESRVMWYPVKSALLAGEINIPHPDSVGQYSMSLGYKNNASGNYSQSMGYKSNAWGPYATAIGYEAVADTNSFSFGHGTKAVGFNSFAFGSKGVDAYGVELNTFTEALGDYSIAFGLGSKASGTGSFVMGANCISSGKFATATGFNSTASGPNSTAMGVNNIASGEVSFAMGSGNESIGQYAFSFGANNDAIGSASVALGLNNTAGGAQSIVGGFSNTGAGFSAFAIGSYNNAQGDGSIAAGSGNQCLGVTSAAFGSGNTSSGSRSFAIGDGCIASATNSVATGYRTTSSGQHSLTVGYQDTTIGTGTIATGYQTSARGHYSVAAGYRTIARAYASFVIGRYNTYVPTSTNWYSTDPLFVAGNGTSTTANDALVLYKNGNMKIDGSFYPNDDGVPTLGLSTNKWNAVYATNNVIQTSDSRMKKEITDINYGLSTILQLHPVSFKWIDFPEQGVRLGLLAQEVQSIVNEIVDIGDDPEHILGLRYSELIPILIKGMQEQQSLIERQKERNVELEKKLEDLALRLDRLESK
jgi:hypothetical protein